ncbi:MAG: EAL domain-containing protein [Acidimicrobiales bacterium]|nr:EAL domain-containing protein [Acidimicrobiales bacterium]
MSSAEIGDRGGPNGHPTGWWKAVVERSSDVLVALDASGTITYVSPSVRRVFGWDESDLVGSTGFHLVHTDDSDRIRMVLERGLGGGTPDSYPTFRLRHQNGSWRHVEARASNLLSLPDVQAFIISIRDVTERVEAEAAVQLRDERYRAVVQASPEAILIHQNETVVHANPAAVRLLGASDRYELVGLDPADLVQAEPDDPQPGTPTGVTGLDRPISPIDRIVRRLDGSTVAVEVTSIPTIWDGFAAIQLIARDVTEARQADQTLMHLATHDPLTGLPNRNLLEDRLRHASARAVRTQRPFAVLFVDLDRFKVINDTFGHQVGDEALREVAGRLTEAVRPGDTVARFGGDEFAVVVEDLLVADTVDLVVERVHAAFDEPIVVRDREISIGGSIGVVVAEEGGDPRTLLRDADTAMYTAKTKGRGQAVRFDAALREQVHRHEELELRLRAALDEHQVVLALQPLVRLADRKVVGVEALMRWDHPERGLLLPEAFLEVADESGILPDLGQELFELACADAARWRTSRQGPDGGEVPWMSINVAASELFHPGYASRILQTLSDHGLPPTSLYLELGEDAILDDPVGAVEALRPLREAGVSVAIDDFGTGYTSLTTLRRLGPDLLKIDQFFVERMTESPSDAAMVRAVIQMGHALGIPVAAEGVELVEQQNFLTVLGCDVAQGFLIARPGPLSSLDSVFDPGH